MFPCDWWCYRDAPESKIGTALSTKERLSVPGAGRTIASASEERARHVRKAVNLLEPAFHSPRAEADFRTVFSPRWDGGATSPTEEPVSTRAAWALVNVWLVAQMTGLKCDILGAERWFFGGHELPSLAANIADTRPASNILSRLSFDDDLLELLPYLLEAHGPGSRLSVMRDPDTRVAREAKRESGVYYTPADVAEYMVSQTLEGHEDLTKLRCLDPSCGTGVYLVALLRTAAERHNDKPFDRFAYATRCLYGIDISSLAVESCAFVLLHHFLTNVSISPWSAWHALRLNLASADALRLKPVNGTTHGAGTRDGIRRQLMEGCYVQPIEEDLPTAGGLQMSLFGEDHFPPLAAMFPEAEAGFEVLVGNPPYATIGHRTDADILEKEYASLRSGVPGADLYPLFIEMMWRLTKPGCSTAALVVPLSIAYHQGVQFRACRQAITGSGGRWRFAFFDREPHALFGEDVKTRNAIVFRKSLPGTPARGSSAELETGPIRKWTSRTRERLFSSVSYTRLHEVSIADGIPKLSGGEQSHAFTTLAARDDHLRALCRRCRTCRPREATLTADHPRVFVASTAYNFLNVFRAIAVDDKYPLSENTVHCLEFSSEEDARIAFAILSSRLTYWLWHVQCDGFHVGAWFIQHLPFGRKSFTPDQAQAIQDCGRRFWEALQAHRIVSVNKGKQTVAYRPLALEQERDAIDELLIEAAKLPKRFQQVLKAFVIDAVVVDDTDSRRGHLKALFATRKGIGGGTPVISPRDITHGKSLFDVQEGADE